MFIKMYHHVFLLIAGSLHIHIGIDCSSVHPVQVSDAMILYSSAMSAMFAGVSK